MKDDVRIESAPMKALLWHLNDALTPGTWRGCAPELQRKADALRPRVRDQLIAWHRELGFSYIWLPNVMSDEEIEAAEAQDGPPGP